MLNNSKVANILKNNEASDIGLKDVTVVAQRATKDPTIKVLNYQLNDYSADRLGFLGSHRSLEVVVQKINSDESETLNFFVKSIPCDNEYQAEHLRNEGVFTKEVMFFQSIAPLMITDYIDEKWLPECYLVKDEMLIMEDLRSENYRVVNSIFDETNKIKSILATVARFHSSSILAEAHLNRHSKLQTTLKECFPEAFEEILFSRTGKLYRLVSNAINLAIILAEHFGLKCQNLRETFERIYDIIKPSKIHRNVTCHSDLWKNNIMIDDTKPVPKTVLVDFQGFRYAPLALDVLQVIYLTTSREFRKKYEKALIEFYHSVLQKTIKNNDTTKIAPIPSIEEVLGAVEDLRLYGAILPCLYYPISLLDPKEITKYTEDPEAYEQFVFGDRTDFTLTQLEKNDSYKNKLKEIITEIVELSEQLNY